MIKRNSYHTFNEGSFVTLIEISKSVFEPQGNPNQDIPIPEGTILKEAATIFTAAFGSSYGQAHYETLEMKAAFIFYSFIKNHPLINGNKRMAVISSTAFIVINIIMSKEANGKDNFVSMKHIDHGQFYDLAIATEKTKSADHKQTLKHLEQEFEKFSKLITDL